MTAVIKTIKKGRAKMNVAKNLKTYRKKAGLTQAELAKKINITQPMIAHIERGAKSPTIFLAEEIATALDISLNDLIK